MDTVAVIKSLETQTTSFSTLGFTFAAAFAWMNFIQWAVSTVLKDKLGSPGGYSLAITALVTSILAVAVTALMQFIQRNTIDRILKNSGQDKYQSM
jgi:hypothetical protein